MAFKCKIEECNAWATGDGYCFAHSPNLADKRAVARQAGGLVGKSPADRIKVDLKPMKLDSLDDIKHLLAETINLVRTGEIDIKVAHCIGNLSHYLRKTIEVSDLEQRLQTIEYKIDQNGNNK